MEDFFAHHVGLQQHNFLDEPVIHGPGSQQHVFSKRWQMKDGSKITWNSNDSDKQINEVIVFTPRGKI